ncbi:hypothetical protein [Salibacterium halotolerans]|uniref:Uncharacterized protein n=1 Tax=Salibacterium halotolerans TaxID=1884432 RepID=A0A1I5NLP3_9BACI|nr:hypothetical protein [Salibacterium halotolerans]SFP22131.1 hypothetical protein SAMN05518683_103182 [Salibacterium halotolerans]
MVKKWIFLFLGLFLGLFLMPAASAADASFFEKHENPSYEEPDHHFSKTTGTITIHHILDNDEYVLESKGTLKTKSPAEKQQVQMILLEDGYVKDSAAAWLEGDDHLTALKRTPSEDSGRYDLAGFYSMKNAPVYTFDWSSSSLYVLDTPISDLHSFTLADSEEEKKAGKMMDTIINQQQQHVKRFIRDSAGLSESSRLFPITRWKQYMSPSVSGLDPRAVEKAWQDVYYTVEDVTASRRKQRKKVMPFVNWNKEQKRLSLFIHYSST